MRPNRSNVCRHVAPVIIAFLVGCGGAVGHAAESDSPKPDFSKLQSYEVVRVEDGAAVVVRIGGKDVTAGLTGIDAAEAARALKAAGVQEDEGTRFVKNLLAGESVCIAQDNANDKTDTQGRMPAYLFRSPDGLFVNLEVIRQGYARADANSRSAYAEQFRAAEQFAREARKGLWSAETQQASRYVLVTADGKRQAIRFVEIKDGKLFYAVTVAEGGASGEITRSVPIGDVRELRRPAAPKSASATPVVPESPAGKSTTPRASGPAPAAGTTKPTPATITVLVMERGEFYHRPTCRLVQKDKIPMSLKQAKELGYAPCKVCRPPE